MNEIIRIQSYLREIARQSYEAEALPPFTLFFHPTDAFKYFNYAIPDLAVTGDLSPQLGRLRERFHARGRTPRFEFFEAFAPELPAALRRNGFVEEDRQWSMLCAPTAFPPAPDVPGLQITRLRPDSPEAEILDFLRAQHEGFEPDTAQNITAQDVTQARERFARGGAFLGQIAGEPAGVSSFSLPIDGVTEVAGVATRIPFRRRGIAARLTWEAARAAFDQGAATACLTAADAAAGRVYERVGFQPFSTMLAYIEQEQP